MNETEIRSPEIRPNIIYEKEDKNIQCGGDSLVSSVGKTGQVHAKE